MGFLCFPADIFQGILVFLAVLYLRDKPGSIHIIHQDGSDKAIVLLGILHRLLHLRREYPVLDSFFYHLLSKFDPISSSSLAFVEAFESGLAIFAECIPYPGCDG